MLIALPSLEEIVDVVSKVFGVKREIILSGRKRLNPARNVALYFSQRNVGLGNEEIGRFFGGLHYSGVSKAAVRVRETMAKDKEWMKIVLKLDFPFKA